MSEKELFNEVLKFFENEYRLTIKRPYNDGYMEFFKDGKSIGGLNFDGYNLLRNLSELCAILESEL